jgi:hypothetical protein
MTDKKDELDNDVYSFNIHTLEGKRRLMQRDLDRYDPRRLMITRADLDELGMEYDGELYKPKP